MLRVAVFVTLATMFILGIVTIPVGIAALSAILFGFADYRASREFMSKAERVVMGIVIVWVTISLLALVAAVIMLTTNNLCLLSCSDTQFALRGAVFFVLLFLWFLREDEKFTQDVIAYDDNYLDDERNDGNPSIRIEM